MKKVILPLLVIALLISCNTQYSGIPEKYYSSLDSAMLKAGVNAIELQKALDGSPENQKEGMAFIISYMPERDLTTLTADFLLENAEYAYKAREEFSWCAELPDSVFFNEVLPNTNQAGAIREADAASANYSARMPAATRIRRIGNRPSL